MRLIRNLLILIIDCNIQQRIKIIKIIIVKNDEYAYHSNSQCNFVCLLFIKIVNRQIQNNLITLK